MSLKQVYSSMREQDHVKVAAARAAAGLPPQIDASQVDPGLLKQAQDYDHIGRVLAHQVFTDLVKQALDEAGVPTEKKDDELAKILAAANGEAPKSEEKKDEEKKDEPKTEEEAKVAAAKKKIMARMAKDPKYVSSIVAKHSKK